MEAWLFRIDRTSTAWALVLVASLGFGKKNEDVDILDTETHVMQSYRPWARPIAYSPEGRFSVSLPYSDHGVRGACEKFWFPLSFWRVSLGVPFRSEDFQDPFVPRVMMGTHFDWRIAQDLEFEAGVEGKTCLTKRCLDSFFTGAVHYFLTSTLTFSLKTQHQLPSRSEVWPSFEENSTQPFEIGFSLLL